MAEIIRIIRPFYVADTSTPSSIAFPTSIRCRRISSFFTAGFRLTALWKPPPFISPERLMRQGMWQALPSLPAFPCFS